MLSVRHSMLRVAPIFRPTATAAHFFATERDLRGPETKKSAEPLAGEKMTEGFDAELLEKLKHFNYTDEDHTIQDQQKGGLNKLKVDPVGNVDKEYKKKAVDAAKASQDLSPRHN